MSKRQHAYVSAESLNGWLNDGHEIALIDPRDKTRFVSGHLWLANNIPVGAVERHIRRFVPNLTTRLVLCDYDGELAGSCADTLADLGYSDLHILDGGIAAWQRTGLPIVEGDYVIAHCFGFHIEAHYKTPVIDAARLQQKIDMEEDIVIVDARDPVDYFRSSLPQSVSVPAAEVVRTIPDLVSSEKTQVVVHCAGITRAALGAQTLVNSGLKNPVFSLVDGTKGWYVSGNKLTLSQPAKAFNPSVTARDFSRKTAERLSLQFSLRYCNTHEFENWKKTHPNRTAYLVDVRSREEYLAGHYPDAMHVPGGELVGMTIDHLATYHARVFLLGNPDCARAEIAASWLWQLGWRDVVIVSEWQIQEKLDDGPERVEELSSELVDTNDLLAKNPDATREELSSQYQQSILARKKLYPQFLRDKPWRFYLPPKAR